MPVFATLRRSHRPISKQTQDEADAAARRLRSVTAPFEDATAGELLRIFAQLSATVGAGAFALAIANGDPETAAETLALGEARGRLIDYFSEAYLDVIETSGAVVADLSEFGLSYTANRIRTVQTALTRTGTLVTEITNETRAAIRRVIADAVIRGDNPRVAARAIRPLVGLTSGHARAVERSRATMIANGLDRAKADEFAARHASRLLRYRTENIARTEMLWANNTGQYDYWRQLAEAGLIDRQTVGVIWVVSDDDRLCPQCAPLAGAVVGFEEPFVSDTLGRPGEALRPRPIPVLTERPPLHPSCRCTLSLETV